MYLFNCESPTSSFKANSSHIDIPPFHMFFRHCNMNYTYYGNDSQIYFALTSNMPRQPCSVSKHCQSTNAYGSKPFSS